MASLRSNLPNLDWSEVQQGEITYLEMPPLETEPAAIAVLFAAQVNGGLGAVLQQLQQPLPDTFTLPIDVSSPETIRRSLQPFTVAAGDDINMRWFRNPSADGTYNVNTAELGLLQQAAAELRAEPKDLEPLNDAIREFFARRVEAYVKQGLAGIESYDIDGKQVAAGDYLAGSLQPLQVVSKLEPGFYQAFLEYPQLEAGSTDKSPYQHHFFLVVENDNGQRITSLRHWMLEQRDNSALIAERKFYISHSLDAMHTLIYIEQAADDRSYVVLSNTTFTQKVTGMGQFIAHKVGRAKIETTIRPMLVSLQNAFR
ncbi:hypothetical protein [Pseudomaricurvus sp. HS19]|uniref:hypothetical protein n=1 Tax=Pseudomaricurvus sp. HS19 TaxID=2692626 RepID=UPI0013688436|nr:hypothetical protein [Pseudomaricurvus sp. HS19]MYM62494.1 hypothetical protein [Pseudomaricurvus sp. HS19]